MIDQTTRMLLSGAPTRMGTRMHVRLKKRGRERGARRGDERGRQTEAENRQVVLVWSQGGVLSGDSILEE